MAHETLNAEPANYAAGPPADWEQAHRQAHKATVHARQAETPTILRNRPVPRSASCHYAGEARFHLTSGPVTFYFY